MFNIIYMRKESGNYKYKHTFNSWIMFLMVSMGLVGTEEIMNIRFHVCDTKKVYQY